MTIVPFLLDIRSTHNVGSIIRSAECFGVTKLVCAGYTPYPEIPNDSRLPHERERATRQINKTALGTERQILIEQYDDPQRALNDYRDKGFTICALEQNPRSIPLESYASTQPILLILGNEPTGIDNEILAICADILEIRQFGNKESLNVSVAAGIAFYELNTQK